MTIIYRGDFQYFKNDENGKIYQMDRKTVVDPETFEPIDKPEDFTPFELGELRNAYSRSELEQFHQSTLAKMLNRRLQKGETKEKLINEILGVNDGESDRANLGDPDD